MMDHPDIRLFRGDQYIQISIRHARTHIDDGRAQFTDYEIELKTNHIAFTIKYSKVRRRYSDFIWLRNRLMKDTMTSDPPALPGRRLFGRFNKDFIKQRQKKLQDFLFGLVQNNVYLSHAALHLFLQSKLSADEINSYLDSNMDEDAAETILAESECKARLVGMITRDRIESKHDSGFSGEYDDPDWLLDNMNVDNMNISNENEAETNLDLLNDNDDEIFSDGHAADVESEDDLEQDDGEKSEEDEELEKEIVHKRLSSLPAPQPLDEDRFESSVEYLLSNSSDSDTSGKRSTRSSTKGSTSDVKSRMSSQENIRNTPKKRSKRRYSRQCSSQRKSLFNSINSLPEYNTTDAFSDVSTPKSKPLRRCQSFYDYNNRSSASQRRRQETFLRTASLTTEAKSRCRSENNCSASRRSRLSFLSSTERTPVKRKISLSEYIIVGRNPVFPSYEEKDHKDFKTSLQSL